MTLPATIDLLAVEPPADPERRLFTRAVQAAFLEALATSGAVRSASASAGVSYRTAYRERRSSPAFRRAWDAALLAARAMSEDVLACRAIEGVEEEVWYHGEVVATRRRYDARLLLAHLARLDKLTQDARTRAFADDYEGALERFAAGIDDPAPVCGGCGEALPLGEDFSPGQCDTCDKPPPVAVPAGLEPCYDCGGACLDPAAELTPADCQAMVNRLTRFYAARPEGVREVGEFPGFAADEVERYQLEAFEWEQERWWLVVPPREGEDDDEWHWFEEDWAMEFESEPLRYQEDPAMEFESGPPRHQEDPAVEVQSIPPGDGEGSEPPPPPPVPTFQPARFRTLEAPPHETASPRRGPGVVWL